MTKKEFIEDILNEAMKVDLTPEQADILRHDLWELTRGELASLRMEVSKYSRHGAVLTETKEN